MEACQLLQEAGKSMMTCIEQVRAETQALEDRFNTEALRKQRDADAARQRQVEEAARLQQEQFARVQEGLGAFQSFIGGVQALYQADAEAEQSRLARRLSAIDQEKQALQDRYNAANVTTLAEAKAYKLRATSIIQSENKIQTAQAAAQLKAQKAAKKFAVLQGAVATASAWAAAAKSGAFAAGAGPAAFFSGFSSVLSAGLGAVVQIKKACAAIGGGGEGGGVGGAASSGGSAPSSPPPQQQFVDQFDRQTEVQQMPAPVNITLFNSQLYSGEQVARMIESMKLHGYIVAANVA